MARTWLAAADGSRDPRIEDLTNLYLVHLTGRALLPLALRLRIRANSVSLSGLAFGAAGAAAFGRWTDWRYAAIGFVLCLLWLIADGLDGMIARATRTTSAFGRFLDGVCDHAVFVLLYVSLAASIGTRTAWLLALCAGIAHAVQATLYEGERTRFHRRLRGDSTKVAATASANPIVRAYDAVAGSLDRLAEPFDRQMNPTPEGRAFVERFADRAVAPLALMALLSNNMRVLLIFVTCLAGLPQAFWVIELTLLSLVLLAGILWLRSIEMQMVRGGSKSAA